MNRKGIDLIMFELYGDPDENHPTYGSLGKDMHTATMYESFVKPLNEEIYEVEDEYGKIHLIGMNMKIKVKRAGKEIEIKGSELCETDQIIEEERK